MSKGKRRNQMCWCSSGEKYKKCCYPDDFGFVWQAKVDNSYEEQLKREGCMVGPSKRRECTPEHGQAHSVSRGSTLSLIAEESHVYSFRNNGAEIRKNHGVAPTRTSIGRASTFRGFCKYHDTELFSLLENAPYSATVEQVFYLSYRALCREIFVVSAMLKAFEGVHDLLVKENLRVDLLAQPISGLLVQQSDLETQKRTFDEEIDSSFTGDYLWINLELDDIAPFACGSAVAPVMDFEGKRLLDVSDISSWPALYVNTISSNGRTHIALFGLADERNVIREFLASLLSIPDSEKLSALLNLMFLRPANLHLKISWWDNMLAPEKEALEERLKYADLSYEEPEPDDLLAPSVTYTHCCKVVDVSSNINA